MRKIKKIITLILMLIVLTNIIIVPTNSYASENGIKAGQVSVTSGKLNVRKKPDTTSAVLKQIKKEKYITLISKQGSWWKVKYNKTSYGYCHSDYIKVVSENERQVSVSSSLNVRKSASTTSKIKDTLQNGERVVVLETKGDFNKVLYYGMKTGFVNKNYLKTRSESNMNYEKQALKVPDFKQTDSRWASVKIGKSGKTIGKIGCATTAIAMMESYRNNKNIYPDTMSKKLSYSSTGNVFWPSDYEVVTSSNNYLKGIYERLKQNKPVLFGAKKSSGAQHWVVITGFKGGNTLTTSAFTINDPGSKSRKTLKQFLNDYPSFYKYFYY